jgi:hypothetical protein
MALSHNVKCILILPCQGSPYLWPGKTGNLLYNTKTAPGKASLDKELKNCVYGTPEKIDEDLIVIHPGFTGRWRLAQDILFKPGVEVYVNGNGIQDCSPNVACLQLRYDLASVAGKPITLGQYKALPKRLMTCPYFGDVAVVVSYKELKTYVDPDTLTLVRIQDHYKQLGITPEEEEEEEDEEDEGTNYLLPYVLDVDHIEDGDTLESYMKKKGWDYVPSVGFTYSKPIPPIAYARTGKIDG